LKFAAALAWDHEACVAGLFRSARSTTSTIVSACIRCWRSAGTALICAGEMSGSGLMALAGGVHGTLGAGDVPATPSTRGAPTQPVTIGDRQTKMAWRSLLFCDIIPNTRGCTVLLASYKGFVRRSVSLHLAIRIRTKRSQ